MEVLVGVPSWDTWMCVDGWTDAGVKARHFNTVFKT
jgi:hypothetical protein